MKLLHKVSLVVTSAVALGLTVGAYAAADEGKPQPAPQAKQAVAPHNHQMERTGATPVAHPVIQKASTGPNIDKDKSKHFHPRDK